MTADAVGWSDINEWLAAKNFPAKPTPTLTIPFGRTIDHGDRQYTEVTLREPSTGDVLYASRMLENGITEMKVINRNIGLIAKIGNIPPPVIEMAGHTVYLTAMAYLADFLEYGPRRSAGQ